MANAARSCSLEQRDAPPVRDRGLCTRLKKPVRYFEAAKHDGGAKRRNPIAILGIEVRSCGNQCIDLRNAVVGDRQLEQRFGLNKLEEPTFQGFRTAIQWSFFHIGPEYTRRIDLDVCAGKRVDEVGVSTVLQEKREHTVIVSLQC